MKRRIILLALLAILGGCVILNYRDNSPEEKPNPTCKINCKQ